MFTRLTNACHVSEEKHESPIGMIDIRENVKGRIVEGLCTCRSSFELDLVVFHTPEWN